MGVDREITCKHNSVARGNFRSCGSCILTLLKLLFTVFFLPELFTKRFKSAAMLAVFAVSAVVHEYALALCLSFFYPVLFVLFMFFGSKCLGAPRGPALKEEFRKWSVESV